MNRGPVTRIRPPARADGGRRRSAPPRSPPRPRPRPTPPQPCSFSRARRAARPSCARPPAWSGAKSPPRDTSPSACRTRSRPVGALRWKNPEPVAPWRGVRTAWDFGNRCVQTASGTPATSGQRRRTARPQRVRARRRRKPAGDRVATPVALSTAGAGEDIVPDTSAERTGTVIVTVDCRLGAMGFLATAGLDGEARDGVSGNLACSTDRRHCAGWAPTSAGSGGDPGRVTVAGESAGGRSVYTSWPRRPRRACTGRGSSRAARTGNCAARSREAAVAAGAAFARKVGCADLSAACLRGKSSAEILAAQGDSTGGPSWAAPSCGTALRGVREGGRGAGPRAERGERGRGAAVRVGPGRPCRHPAHRQRYPAVVKEAWAPVRASACSSAIHSTATRRRPSPTPPPSVTTSMACPALRLDAVLAGRSRVRVPVRRPHLAAVRVAARSPSASTSGRPTVNEVQYLFKHFGAHHPAERGAASMSRQLIPVLGVLRQGWGAACRRAARDARRSRPGALAADRLPGRKVRESTESTGSIGATCGTPPREAER